MKSFCYTHGYADCPTGCNVRVTFGKDNSETTVPSCFRVECQAFKKENAELKELVDQNAVFAPEHRERLLQLVCEELNI